MRRPIVQGAPVVLKVGSSSLALPGGGVDPEAVRRVVRQVEELWELGHPTVLVTSGAVAAGLPALGLDRRPRDLPGLQAAAAVGQGRLMERYTNEFAAVGRVAGQVLLTRDILAHRTQYLHARDALERLLAMQVVPIVNENDTVVVDELKLGDNDRLAAIVSHLVGAGMMILLTDTAGLYSDDPRLHENAQLLTAVRHTDEILDAIWERSTAGEFGSGGVATKISAARMAAWSGIPTVIAEATDVAAPRRAVAGEDVGTWVEPHPARLSARKLWIAFGTPSRGVVVVDAGAVDALTRRGASLLPAGIVDAVGEFAEGDAVEVRGSDDTLVGKGLARMASVELRRVLDAKSTEAGGVAIHRDDLVILRAGPRRGGA